MDENTIVIDPTSKEVNAAQNILCIGYMLNSKKIPYMISRGKTMNELLEKVPLFNFINNG